VFGFLGKQNLVDEPTVQWLFDTFEWALLNLDADVFFDESRLVIPSNEYFPGKVNSVDGMARLIFDHVKTYAGMQHWPFVVMDQAACAVPAPAPIRIDGPLRGSRGMPQQPGDSVHHLAVSYDPALVSNPEALIAGYAHALAHYLGQTASTPPPGGADYWPQATEVVAIFMGFGLMFANSAFTVPVRSCGSCGPRAERRSYLTQHESTYALALFCVLKDVPASAVLKHLKKPLRPFFRQAVRDIRDRKDDAERLAALHGPATGAVTSGTSSSHP